MINFIHSILGFKKLSPPQKIALSFLLVIFLGAFLLTLPISTKSGTLFHPIDALFIATSATCVTGLTTYTIAETFNTFGQIVLLLLIQIGGLGLMTLMAMLLVLSKHRLSVNEKKVMKEMLNKEHMLDMKRYITDILKYTLCFELIGACLLAFHMVPKYGWLQGGFHSIFLAVSAFCNAGFDVLGATSLQQYVHDPLICITVMCLITLGGLGFAVWFDLRDHFIPFLTRKISFRKFKKAISLHTRIVLIVSTILIFGAGMMFLITEWNNVDTIGTFTLPQKIMTVLFESVALRTAGFTSIPYSALTPSTSLLMIVVMFIGGSPGGTAGGIKTTTMAIVILYIMHMLKEKEQMIIQKRAIKKEIVIRAMGIFFINLFTLFIGIFLLTLIEPHSFMSLCFEAVSALATVGSTLGITANLSVLGKIIIILMMYIGRIGITTLIISFARPKSSSNASNKVSYPNGNIIVG